MEIIEKKTIHTEMERGVWSGTRVNNNERYASVAEIGMML